MRSALGTFERDLAAELLPRQVGGVPLGDDGDGLAVDDQAPFPGLDRARELLVHAVVLQQVRQGLRAGQVIDRGHAEVGAGREQGAEEATADTAEAVDAYADRHEPISSLVRRPCGAGELCLGCPRPPTTLPP